MTLGMKPHLGHHPWTDYGGGFSKGAIDHHGEDQRRTVSQVGEVENYLLIQPEPMSGSQNSSWKSATTCSNA
jgi:hypothetical protein